MKNYCTTVVIGKVGALRGALVLRLAVPGAWHGGDFLQPA